MTNDEFLELNSLDKYISDQADKYFNLHQKQGGFHIPGLRALLYQTYFKGLHQGMDLNSKIND